MLKTLAILAVLLSILQTPIPVPGQTANQTTPEGKKQDNEGKGRNYPRQTTPSASKPEDNSHNLKPEPRTGSDAYQQPSINITNPAPAPVPWPLHDQILWLANLILAGVGICGVIAAVCTLIILNRQTNHMVTSERAWIICKIDNLGIPNVPQRFEAETFFQFENVGKTPGFILEYGWRIIDLPSDEILPETPPDYRGEGCDFAVYDRLPISPQGTINRHGRVVSEDPRVLHIGGRTVWAHGYIRYCDSFSNTVHETRACFKWLPNRANSGLFEFSIDGPSAYNRST
jgi:hypothetical protein